MTGLLAMTIQVDATWPAVAVAALGLLSRYLPTRSQRRPARLRVAVIRPGRRS